MPSEFINLLPPDRLRAFRAVYRSRLLAAGGVALIIIVAIHAGMLIPSYLYLTEQGSAHERTLAEIDAQLAASPEGDANAELALLSSEAARLVELQKNPSGSDLISAILSVSREGIALFSFSFEPPQDGAMGRLVIAGNARDRETLRAYVRSLEALPFVTSVDLPLGAYAKETDISFDVTLSGPLLP